VIVISNGMNNTNKEIQRLQKEIDVDRADVRRVQAGAAKHGEAGLIESSSQTIEAKKQQRKKGHPHFDAIIVAAFCLFAGISGVYFVGQMSEDHRFALMTGMGGLGSGLLIGFAIGQRKD